MRYGFAPVTPGPKLVYVVTSFLVGVLGGNPPQADLRPLRTMAGPWDPFTENFAFLYGEIPLRPLEWRMHQPK